MKLRKLTALATLVLLSTASIAAVPTVSPQAAAAADAINQDPLMQKILAEAVSPEGQKWRFNTQMEIVVLHPLLVRKCVVKRKSCAALRRNGALLPNRS